MKSASMSRRYLAIPNRLITVTRSLSHTHSKWFVPLFKNTKSESRSIHTQSKTECEAIAEQCLLEAKLIQQRHRKELTSHLSPPSTPSRSHFQKPSSLSTFTLSPNPNIRQRQKWKWKWRKYENEEKEEIGIWLLLITAIFLGSAGYGGGSAFWEELSRLKEPSLYSPS